MTTRWTCSASTASAASSAPSAPASWRRPSLGGYGVGEYSIGGQVVTQIIAVVVTILWTGIGSLVLYKIVDMVVGLRVTPEAEREGLDLAEHGERAYNY